MISKNHVGDHMISRQDYMTNEQQDHMTSGDNVISEQSNLKFERTNRQDHAISADVSNITMYYEATSHSSLHSNSKNDVTDGDNTYDVQKELDEILSKSDLVDGTHLNLPTQLATTIDSTTTIATGTTTSTTSTATVTVDATSVIVTDTSLTKSYDTQSNPTVNSKLNSPMSDSVNLFVCVSLETNQ